MATRFYFPASTAAPVTPPSPHVLWTYTSEEVTRALSRTKGSSAIGAGTQIGAWTTTNFALDRRYISEPMAGGISFNGVTFKGQLMVREYANGDNSDRIILSIRIISQDGSTVQTTLVAPASHVAGAEFINNASHRNKKIADGDSITTLYTTVAGDRLEIAIGYTDNAGATPEASAKWGENATELPENETQTTDGAGWIEFSNNIAFALMPSAIGPAEGFGTAKANGVVAPSGVATAETFGTALLRPGIGPYSFHGVCAQAFRTTGGVGGGGGFIQKNPCTSDLQFGNEDFSAHFFYYIERLGTGSTGVWAIAASSGSGGMQFSQLSSGKVRWRVSDGTTAHEIDSTTTLTARQWYRIALRHSATDDKLYLHVDEATADEVAHAVGCDATQSRFIVGGIVGANDDGWFAMASLGIWRKSLSTAELAALYAGGRRMLYADLTGSLLTSLEGWWNLTEEGTGTTRADSTGTNDLAASFLPTLNAIPGPAGVQFGTSKVSGTIVANGIGTAEAHGTTSARGVLGPTGIASAEAFGTASLAAGTPQLRPSAIASAEAFGTPTMRGSVAPSGIGSAEAFGTTRLVVVVRPTGIATAETFGVAMLRGGITPTAIASGEAFGAARTRGLLAPGGIGTSEGFGTATLSGGLQSILAVAVGSAETFGTATITGGTPPAAPSAGGGWAGIRPARRPKRPRKLKLYEPPPLKVTTYDDEEELALLLFGFDDLFP